MFMRTIVLAGAIVLAGCATTEPSWVKEPLRAVELPKRVYMTQSPEYRPPRFAQGTPFFTILGLMQVHRDSDNAERFEQFARESDLGLEQIVLDVFGEEVRSNGPFESMVDRGGDGQIQLVVAEYGLERGWSFRRSKPLLRLEARLFDTTGKMLWEEIADVNGFSEVAQSRTVDGWLADPDALRSAFEAAVRAASTELVDKMKGYRG